VQTPSQEKVTGITHYGKEVVASLADSNIFATQFHPEKSQAVGLTLLRNFLRWDGSD
jgi:imidazole glycerol-phosphate synthase subunit HisH